MKAANSNKADEYTCDSKPASLQASGAKPGCWRNHPSTTEQLTESFHNFLMVFLTAMSAYIAHKIY